MLNLSMLIEHHARLHPDREAIVAGSMRLTYAQLDAAACRVAGVEPGDHVALSCPNTSHFPIAYFGILKTGAAVVPLNVLLKPREISQHLRDCAARAYLSAGAMFGSCSRGTRRAMMYATRSSVAGVALARFNASTSSSVLPTRPLGVLSVALSGDDVRELEGATARIEIRGARYPEFHERLTGQ